MTALESANKIKAQFGDLISEPADFRGEVTVKLADAEQITAVCEVAKGQLGFDYLVDISSVDIFGEEPRFEVVYELSSIATNEHLRLKISVSEDEPTVESITGIWPTANWHEREIFDMMGISFSGHPDLRRILMWDGYPYFPLRKDFPLAGKPSDLPGIAFTKPAPLEGGPFVTIAGGKDAISREPRIRNPEE